MRHYKSLIASIFRTISDGREAHSLAITATGSFEADPKRGEQPQQSEFPGVFLPDNSDHHQILGVENFADDVCQVVSKSAATAVFLFPPMIGDSRLSPEWREKHGSAGIPQVIANDLFRSEEAESSVSGQKPGAELQCVAMLVPRFFITSPRMDEWRREFFPAHAALIIEHELEMFNPAVMLDLVTVVFQKNPGPIRFFKVVRTASEDEAKAISADLRKLMKQPAGKSKYGYVLSRPLAPGYPVTFDFYSEDTERLRQEISILGERVPLQTVADVMPGFHPVTPNRVQNGQQGFLFISAQDIKPDGRVDLSALKVQDRPCLGVSFLQDGDYCLRKLYPEGRGLVVGVYEGTGQAVSWNSSIVVLRPKPSLSPPQRHVLLSYLQSSMAQRLSDVKKEASRLGGALQLSTSLLREFPVPVADAKLVAAIEELSEAKAAFTRWIQQIDLASSAILTEDSPSNSREKILAAGQLARQRYRAGLQTESLDFRIQTQFPHPLAFLWREVQVSGPDRYHQLRTILKAAEGHTCFLALTAILLSRAIVKPIRYLETIATRLCTRGSGTNFGDWIAVLKEVNEGRAFRQSEKLIPFSEVTELCSRGMWEPAIRRLKELRDDDSHGRISPGSVSATVLNQAKEDLESVFKATEFLTEFRLLLIVSTRFDAIRSLTRIEYRDLSGDNVLVPLQQDVIDRNDIEADSLYFRDRQGNLHLFRPLLQYLECPECHQMSTFFLDTYSGKGNVVGLKSFERSSVREEEMADDFRHFGLLTKNS